MARSIYLEANVDEVSRLVNAAALHTDAYALSHMQPKGDGKVALVFESAGATNPESDDSFFTDFGGMTPS